MKGNRGIEIGEWKDKKPPALSRGVFMVFNEIFAKQKWVFSYLDTYRNNVLFEKCPKPLIRKVSMHFSVTKENIQKNPKCVKM